MYKWILKLLPYKTSAEEPDYCSHAPDWLPACGEIGKTACRLHDYLYEKGGDAKRRKIADMRLRDIIYQQAKRRCHRIRGFIVSRLYYWGVRIGSSYVVDTCLLKLEQMLGGKRQQLHFSWHDK